MTVYEILASVLVAFFILATSGWLGFVMVTRRKALAANLELKRLAIERGAKVQEKLLGAVGEGTGFIPGDSVEAAREERAILRAQGR